MTILLSSDWIEFNFEKNYIRIKIFYFFVREDSTYNPFGNSENLFKQVMFILKWKIKILLEQKFLDHVSLHTIMGLYSNYLI